MNRYKEGERVRCEVVFTDPQTVTALKARIEPGQTVLQVRSGILGAGFPAGAAIVLGEGLEADFLTVASAGASATAIPVTSPVLHPHHVGEEVALLVDPETVTWTVRAPKNGPVSHPSGTRDQIGRYHTQVVGSRRGSWRYEAEGNTGGVASGAFLIDPP